MALSVQNYIKLANFYNEMLKVLSAICVEKGGISMENYVGRFFAADVLEYIMEYGNRLKKSGANLTPEILSAMNLFEKQFEKVKDLVTPNQKPIYEMTLEEFEKIMNI
ncbi:MAG: hypothetical protein IKN73_03010 [Alphaproteobacteria bacterium]|nr:hypothetical protein [Alphaproteobacteria bacterium]